MTCFRGILEGCFGGVSLPQCRGWGLRPRAQVALDSYLKIIYQDYGTTVQSKVIY